MINTYFKIETIFRMTLYPTAQKVNNEEKDTWSNYPYLIAYPPQLAPAATARSGSIFPQVSV
jgi:hypothetical protein